MNKYDESTYDQTSERLTHLAAELDIPFLSQLASSFDKYKRSRYDNMFITKNHYDHKSDFPIQEQYFRRYNYSKLEDV